jgi:hypothetical protein
LDVTVVKKEKGKWPYRPIHVLIGQSALVILNTVEAEPSRHSEID